MTAFYLTAVAVTILLGVLALYPLWKSSHRSAAGIAAVAVLAIGFGAYQLASNYDPEAPLIAAGDMRNEVQSLAARLEANPDDADGWALLARSYMSVGNYPAAGGAFRKAVGLQSTPNPDLLLDFAEALVEVDRNSVNGEAGQVIENALRLAPSNLRAIWYGATVAAARGDNELAATRFEQLLRPDTPADVRSVIERNIASLRGQDVSVAAAPSAQQDLRVSIDIESARQRDWPSSAVFYLIATTAAGGPPLAVVRQPVSTIPGVVEIGDADAMMPGRDISSVDAVKLIARVSLSGQPIASSGDVFGELDISLPMDETIAITLDQVVP